MTFHLIDRPAYIQIGLFALALVGVLIAGGATLAGGAPMTVWQALFLGFLALLFGILLVVNLGAARSRLVVGPTGVSRGGPRTWSLTPNEIASVNLSGAGRLVIRVADQAARRTSVARAISESWWFSGVRERRSIALLVRPDDVPRVREALAAANIQTH